jgi:hypothetical protein
LSVIAFLIAAPRLDRDEVTNASLSAYHARRSKRTRRSRPGIIAGDALEVEPGRYRWMASPFRELSNEQKVNIADVTANARPFLSRGRILILMVCDRQAIFKRLLYKKPFEFPERGSPARPELPKSQLALCPNRNWRWVILDEPPPRWSIHFGIGLKPDVNANPCCIAANRQRCARTRSGTVYSVSDWRRSERLRLWDKVIKAQWGSMPAAQKR